MKISEISKKSAPAAKMSGRARMAALRVGESVTLRGIKPSTVRVTAVVLGRDLGRVYSVSAPKGRGITVSRVK